MHKVWFTITVTVRQKGSEVNGNQQLRQQPPLPAKTCQHPSFDRRSSWEASWNAHTCRRRIGRTSEWRMFRCLLGCDSTGQTSAFSPITTPYLQHLTLKNSGCKAHNTAQGSWMGGASKLYVSLYVLAKKSTVCWTNVRNSDGESPHRR